MTSVAAALTEFGLGPSEVMAVDPLPQGIKNRNYKVRGPEQDWVLKCHRGSGAAERLAFTHRVELALGEAGFPLAPIRRLDSGGTTVETPAGIFTLHGWVDGHHVSIDQREQVLAEHPSLVEGLGRLLGESHRVTAGLLDEAHPDRARRAGVSERLAAPRSIASRIRRGGVLGTPKTLRLRLGRRRSEFDSWIVGVLADVTRRADFLALPEVAAQVDPADVVVAHNDLNWENLVLDQAYEVTAVLDFDNAALLPRALDVGAAAVVLVGPDSSTVDRFLTAYGNASGVRVERSAVEVGMKWKCVRSILWTIDAYLSGAVGDPEMAATWCKHLYASAQALPLEQRSQGCEGT